MSSHDPTNAPLTSGFPEPPPASPHEISETITQAGPNGSARRSHRIWLIRLFDLLAVLALFAAAIPIRWQAASGDLWLDEADYAFAAVRGVEANRRDLPESLAEPDKIIRFRHFHPPLVAYAVQLGLRRGPDQRSIRAPFVVAGAATVSLLYLCGVTLFAGCTRPRPSSPGEADETVPGETPPLSSAPPTVGEAVTARAAALACACVLLLTPAHIRASSHALPWAFITLWLVLLAWCMAGYAGSGRAAWIVALGATMGGLFVTSEYALVALAAIVCAAPFLFWRDFRSGSTRPLSRGGIALACLGGVIAFLVIAWAGWPAGLAGGSVKMLRHYVEMSHDAWPVQIRGQVYDHAPKWAYAYWYARFYGAYFIWYALGLAGLAGLAVRRRLTPGVGAVAALTLVLLAAAHKSHIIGPEYLVHALPLLTLLGGLFVVFLSGVSLPVGLATGAVMLTGVALSPSLTDLSGMDARSQWPRWSQAAKFLATRWRRDDKMLAPAYGGVGRWYVLHVGGIAGKEWQVQALPGSDAGPKLLHEIAIGGYRFIAVGSTFVDQGSIDPKVRRMIKTWPAVWRSDEGGHGPSRLVIYQLPRGVTPRTPLPMP